MTETTSDVDVVRAFTAALTPAAREHLRHVNGYDQIRLINRACATTAPVALAKTVSRGITRTTPANAPGLIRYRLERAAGVHDEPQEDAH